MNNNNLSYDDLLAQMPGLGPSVYQLTDFYTPLKTKDVIGNAVSSGIQGAKAGASFSPIGTAIGGVLGTAGSLLSSYITNEKNKETAEKQLLEKNREQDFLNNSFNQEIGNINMLRTRNMLANSAEFGGSLQTQGGLFPTGLTFIDNGGTHEENVLGGVPYGISQDGVPNFVEEGEVVWNDYVFSNRINVPESVKKKFQLKGDNNMTFANAVKKVHKASAERPNDPIEKRTLNTLLAGLMQEQEIIRQNKAEKEQLKQLKKLRALGGRLFQGGGLLSPEEYNRILDLNLETPIIGFPQGTSFGNPLSKSWGMTDWSNVGQEEVNTADVLNTLISKNPFSLNYTPKNETLTSKENSKENSAPPSNKGEAMLRYAPILGSAIGLGYTLLNQPDHKYADELEASVANYTNSIPHVNYTPLGDYLTYNPFDRVFYANELAAQQAATRRDILNVSNNNRGTALAGLLAADYNGNIGLGKLFRESEEYNLAQRQKVAEFNRATNMYNSEADFKTQMINAELDKARASVLLNAKMNALGLKQSEDQAWNTSLAANLTGLFDNVGNVGWGAVNRNMISTNPALYYDIDRDGTIHYKNMSGLSRDEQDYIKWKTERDAANKKSKGGYLTIKNRRRRNA